MRNHRAQSFLESDSETLFIASDGEAFAAVMAGKNAPNNETKNPDPIAMAIGVIPGEVLGIEIPKRLAVD